MESECNVVLSLQERCLLYLITHVEDYSPQTLALLPKHLRRALLSSVAPLHLYQLDQTAVASGIETKTLWTGMYYSDRNLAGLTHRWGYQSITSRKSFSSLIDYHFSKGESNDYYIAQRCTEFGNSSVWVVSRSPQHRDGAIPSA